MTPVQLPEVPEAVMLGCDCVAADLYTADQLRAYATEAVMAERRRVLGMVAENEARKACGNSPAYDESDFFATALEIETIARRV